LKLATRFFVPLVLWFTVGQLLRYGIYYAGYRFMNVTWIPVIALSFGVLTVLAVTVLMLHSIRDGLPAIRRMDMDQPLAPWAARQEESMFDAMGRALFPFLIFYIAWGWFSNDAREFISGAEGRGFAEGGLYGQLEGFKILTRLMDHIYIAAIATVIFFIVKSCTEWWVLPRLARVGALLLAVFELHWTLFGVFTVDYYRGDASNWITDRAVWTSIGGHLSWLGALWGPFKFAVLGGLVWLVIAGVILGVDGQDEAAAVGTGRIGRGLAAATGIHKHRSPREVLSRELREKWFPAVHGFRMVRRAGWMPFAVFCVLFVGLDVGQEFLRRGAYYLIGPHPVAFWMQWLSFVNFGVDLVHDLLRICLLGAAFNLLVARVSARNEERRVRSAAAGYTAEHASPAPLS
jgi:uncharacterized membrane protein